LTQRVYKAGIFEELSEYYRAKDDNERIDALCDMAIFTINYTEVNKIKVHPCLYGEIIESEEYKINIEGLEDILISHIFQSIEEPIFYTNVLSDLRSLCTAFGYQDDKTPSSFPNGSRMEQVENG
jgi:hypothetical protein